MPHPKILYQMTEQIRVTGTPVLMVNVIWEVFLVAMNVISVKWNGM